MRVRLTLLAVLVFALPRPAMAWHSAGHMAIARIAWKHLDDDQRKQAYQILQKHPRQDAFLAVGRPTHVAKPVWFFVKAATWPDWIKNPVPCDWRPAAHSNAGIASRE